jgi:hypothetical protein
MLIFIVDLEIACLLENAAADHGERLSFKLSISLSFLDNRADDAVL